MRRSICIAAIAAPFVGLSSGQAQDYPAGPIHIVVPYPPGGATDVFARIVGKRMSELLGKPVVVENMPGAAGAIGTRRVAQARPDGYTLLLGTAAQAVRMAFPQPGFDFRADFIPLAHIAAVPNVILAHPDFAPRTLQELIDHARRNPEQVRVGSTGTAGSAHLGLELLQSLAGIRMVHVPYKGSAPGMNDVMAGHIPVMIDALSTAVPVVQAGRLRALAVTSRSRSRALPQVPAVAEAVPGYEAEGWYGLFAVARTPSPAVATLQATLEKVLGEAEFQARAFEMGALTRVVPSDRFADFVSAEVAKWTRLVAERRITAD